MKKPRNNQEPSPMACRPKATNEPADIDEPGTIIAEGTITGRAVPWKSPSLGKNGGVNRKAIGYGAFKSWQDFVHVTSARCRRKRRPYKGDVAIHAEFYLHPRPGSKPDLGNLQKAFDDALEGTIIHNDTQVCANSGRRVISATEPERVEFKVIAL